MKNRLTETERIKIMDIAVKSGDFMKNYPKMTGMILGDTIDLVYPPYDSNLRFRLGDSELKNGQEIQIQEEMKAPAKGMRSCISSFLKKLFPPIDPLPLYMLLDSYDLPEERGQRPVLTVTLRTRKEDLKRLIWLKMPKTLSITINSMDFLEHNCFEAIPKASEPLSKDSQSI